IVDASIYVEAEESELIGLKLIQSHWKKEAGGSAIVGFEYGDAGTAWLYATFLKSMSDIQPKTIVTDLCQAMSTAIAKCFPQSKHRLCVWHLFKNSVAHLGNLKDNLGFNNLFSRIFTRCHTDEELNHCWNRQKMQSQKMMSLRDQKGILQDLCGDWIHRHFQKLIIASSNNEITRGIVNDCFEKEKTEIEAVITVIYARSIDFWLWCRSTWARGRSTGVRGRSTMVLVDRLSWAKRLAGSNYPVDRLLGEKYHNQFMELSTYASDLKLSDENRAVRFEKGLIVHIIKRLLASALQETRDVRDSYLRAGHAERLAQMTKNAKKAMGDKRKAEIVSEGTRGSKKLTYNHFKVYSTGDQDLVGE
ncbi:hypothetical protein KSS87_005415, partial [Heliosperma pusillum]